MTHNATYDSDDLRSNDDKMCDRKIDKMVKVMKKWYIPPSSNAFNYAFLTVITCS